MRWGVSPALVHLGFARGQEPVLMGLCERFVPGRALELLVDARELGLDSVDRHGWTLL